MGYRAGISRVTGTFFGQENDQLTVLQFLIRFRERVHREFQVPARMGGGNLGANAGGSMRDYRIEKTDDVNAFLQHAGGESLREGSVAEHDGNDRVCAGFDRQATPS